MRGALSIRLPRQLFFNRVFGPYDVAATAVNEVNKALSSVFRETEFRPAGLWLFNIATQKWACLLKMRYIDQLGWANDGKHIYFETVGKTHAIYRVRTVDGHLERIVNLQGFSGSPAWAGVTPDGSPLVVHSFNLQEIYALDVEWP